LGREAAWGHDKVLRAARTIADLDQGEFIGPAHLKDAINYRMLAQLKTYSLLGTSAWRQPDLGCVRHGYFQALLTAFSLSP